MDYDRTIHVRCYRLFWDVCRDDAVLVRFTDKQQAIDYGRHWARTEGKRVVIEEDGGERKLPL